MQVTDCPFRRHRTGPQKRRTEPLRTCDLCHEQLSHRVLGESLRYSFCDLIYHAGCESFLAAPHVKCCGVCYPDGDLDKICVSGKIDGYLEYPRSNRVSRVHATAADDPNSKPRQLLYFDFSNSDHLSGDFAACENSSLWTCCAVRLH